MSAKNNTNNAISAKSTTRPKHGILKTFGVIIVALALVGLVFSSIYSGSQGNTGRLKFGRYGDREIVYRYDNAFGQAVEDEMAKYRSSYDQDNQFFSFVRLIAWQQAFNRMVVNTAMAYQLDSSGYTVSPRAVDRRIVEFGPYRTDGVFDERKYSAASAARKAAVRDQFREQLTLETWARDTLDAQYRSTQQLDFLNDMRSPVRSYDYVTMPFSDFPVEEVVRYGTVNSSLFEQAPVSRITLADEKTAAEVLSLYQERRQELGAFSALAAEYSQDSYKDDGGSMGATDFYRVSELTGKDNADAVFALPEGEVAGPIETEYGWMLFRKDGKTVTPVIENRVDDIRSYMLQNEGGIIEDSMLARAEELRAEALASEDFQVLMSENGLDVSNSGEFPVNYSGDTLLGGSPENSGDPALSGANQSEEFWEKIAVLNEIGEISQPMVLSGSVAIFSLASSQEAEELSYWEGLVNYEMARENRNSSITISLMLIPVFFRSKAKSPE